MGLKRSFQSGALLIAVFVGCTVTTGTNSNCSPDSTVSGCTAGSLGYSCTGTQTPAASNASLTCSTGIPGNAGSTVYCCQTVPSGGADSGITNDANADAGIVTNEAGVDAGVAAIDAGVDVVSPAADAAVDAGVCAVSADTGSANCDQCLNSTCCSALVACDTPDDAGVNDGGASACEQLLGCTLDCVVGNPDAGVDAGSLSDCQALCGPTYTSSEQQNANAVLQCQISNCSQSCQ